MMQGHPQQTHPPNQVTQHVLLLTCSDSPTAAASTAASLGRWAHTLWGSLGGGGAAGPALLWQALRYIVGKLLWQDIWRGSRRGVGLAPHHELGRALRETMVTGGG